MKTISCWMIICLFGFQELHKVIGSKPQCIQFNKLDVDLAQFKTSLQHSRTVEDRFYQELQMIEKYEEDYFVCKNIEKSDDVKLAKPGLRELRAENYTAVIFLRCNIDVIPNDFLASTEAGMYGIYFFGCKMKKLMFDLISPPRYSFQNLLILYSLVETKAISSGAFRQNDQMTNVFMAHNNIERVEADAFLGSTKLQNLLISKNKIRSLDKAALRGLTNLQFLDLSQNEIQSLDEETFKNLTNLQYLHIADNKLKMLNTGIFDSLKNLIGLNLTGNNFHCDCKLQWLQNWLRDNKVNNSRFQNHPINCSTPMKGNLETLNFCTMGEDAPITKNKTQPRDCDMKKLVALNMLRKSLEKIMDDLFQKYLGHLDTDKLCNTDISSFKQPFVPEESNTNYVKTECTQNED